jgi:molybdopterin/thiamine biosynthesis adenylyltransferase
MQWRAHGDGWLFVAREKHGLKQRAPVYLRFIRALRASRDDFAARIPELKSLSTKKVMVVGLGTLGAPSAIEIARCGMAELRLLDCDFVEPGTTVRWPLGWQVFGRRKTKAIAEFISRHYPTCKVSEFFHRIGSVEGPTRDGEIIEAMLDGVDLIYDASAEFGINHLFSSLALERGVPYIWVSTTPGAWGGIVGRIKEGKTKGCWKCYYTMLSDGVIKTPNQDPNPMVQPVGCSDLTFFGPGFDIGNIALAGVRLAVSTICADDGGYPDVNWDVGVVNLRDSGGLPVPPTWTTYSLDEHSSHPHA